MCSNNVARRFTSKLLAFRWYHSCANVLPALGRLLELQRTARPAPGVVAVHTGGHRHTKASRKSAVDGRT